MNTDQPWMGEYLKARASAIAAMAKLNCSTSEMMKILNIHAEDEIDHIISNLKTNYLKK